MKDISIPVSPNLSLPGYEWQSQQSDSKGKIVFLHGFTNHSGNYAYLGEWFSAQGYDFIAYDHRDHGRSPLRNQPCTLDDVLNDARAVINYIYKENNKQKIMLMGSSMGGAISILASQGDIQNKLSGLVLWAPQVVSTNRRKLVFKGLSLVSGMLPNFKLSTTAVTVNNLPKQCDDKMLTDQMTNDKLMLRNPSLALIHRVLHMGDLASQAKFQKDFPVLMLFGGDDTLIYKHDIKMFVKRVEESDANIKYIFYPENRHILWGDMNRETIYQDTLEWIEG
jgi:acylglycerol lipase